MCIPAFFRRFAIRPPAKVRRVRRFRKRGEDGRASVFLFPICEIRGICGQNSDFCRRFILLAILIGAILPTRLACAQTLPPTTPSASSTPPAPLPYTGVNLSGAEFGPHESGKRAIYGKNYTYPTVAELDYFAARGVNIIRLPFAWENLQLTLLGPFDPAELGRIDAFVQAATSRGLTLILDPHNYARYYGQNIGTPEDPAAAFVDLWTRLATRFKDNPRVWFGLMNEPFDHAADQWLVLANAAVAAVRQTGATNLILVPGTAWTGAHSWLTSGNGAVMAGIVDPQHHFVIEAHQYLDPDSSGQKPETVSATVGSERLEAFTLWCREHHQHAFLGEFAAGNSETGARAIDDLLGYMERNADVWTGYTWWAAGPWWGDYMFSLEPKDGTDAPFLRWLAPHLQPTPANAR